MATWKEYIYALNNGEVLWESLRSRHRVYPDALMVDILKVVASNDIGCECYFKGCSTVTGKNYYSHMALMHGICDKRGYCSHCKDIQITFLKYRNYARVRATMMNAEQFSEALLNSGVPAGHHWNVAKAIKQMYGMSLINITEESLAMFRAEEPQGRKRALDGVASSQASKRSRHVIPSAEDAGQAGPSKLPKKRSHKKKVKPVSPSSSESSESSVALGCLKDQADSQRAHRWLSRSRRDPCRSPSPVHE